jgi:hypothetical protein
MPTLTPVPPRSIRSRAMYALWKRSGLPHDAKGYVASPEESLI